MSGVEIPDNQVVNLQPRLQIATSEIDDPEPLKLSELPKMEPAHLTSEADDADDEGDEVLLFVEMKYCTVCHLEQPLRTKHCKACDHCVATHDHHCPWIGSCVGERNKARFWYYLVL